MNADTRAKWITKYKVILEANKSTTGSIDLEKLKEMMKFAIPNHKLSYNDIVQILNTFDTNSTWSSTSKNTKPKSKTQSNFSRTN